MKTPILDFVKDYAERGDIRLHMPGHKGRGVLGIEALDITEVSGADVLYSADGIIGESMAAATSLFGTGKTVFSTEGSSLCIRAMLYLVKKNSKREGKAKILAARNVHKTFLTASAILDIDVSYLPSRESVLACPIDLGELREAIVKECPDAVYVTSPDYLGNCADIAEIATLCHELGTYLLVDNAHGAYLKFLTPSRHPIDLGADVCCDSAHKTLPVLTGGAYLHISKTAPRAFLEDACDALALFASTSPSYLILASLDAANKRLSESFCEEIKAVAERKDKLCASLSKHGYTLVGNEPMKITLAPKSFGYTGNELAGLLEEDGIVCEAADNDFTVLMLSADTTDEDIEKVARALLSYERKCAIMTAPPSLPETEAVLTPREAIFSPYEVLPLSECKGKIFADTSVSCPPAIPIVICGEKINGELLKILEYYGVKSCKVVKE